MAPTSCVEIFWKSYYQQRMVNLLKAKWFALLLIFLYILPFTSCAAAYTQIHIGQDALQTITPGLTGTVTMTPVSTIEAALQVTAMSTSIGPAAHEPAPGAETPLPLLSENPTENVNPSEGDAMKTILITMGSAAFPAKLYDNETTRALLAQFPLKLDMSELNGREKYYHLPENLHAERTETPATIQAGEIMLWSSDSLVLFYKTFANSYGGYVKLGYVEDVTGLATALGSGSAQVTFEISH
jgi:hypothetical protein